MTEIQACANFIPIEIVHSIIEYCSDIDVRRSFGIYAKINVDPFRNILTPGRISSTKECGKRRQNVLTTQAARYSIHNTVQLPERKQQNIMDDAIQVVIREIPYSKNLHYDIDIYQLRTRTRLPENREKETECKFPLGTLGNRYYWNAMLYSFVR